MKRFLSLVLFLPFFTFAQAPSGYYDGAANLTGYALKSKLHEIISAKNVNWHYGDLPAFYNRTDLDQYYDYGAGNTTILLDIYSENPGGPDAYEYTSANLIGSASAEGLGWNREHMIPQSTFNSNYPMYSDMFYVIPTDARINQLRSNFPYGIAGSPNFHTFSNGSKISRNGTPNSGYTGRVYEPLDEFKGDVARSLLYFAVRYEGKLSFFNFSNGNSAANDTSPFDGTEEKAFENWYLAMLQQWHQLDPVSQREMDRNNAVFALQKNRNPFIDHPEWVNYIWTQTPDAVAPQAPTNLHLQRNSAFFVDLSWTPTPETDVLGYKIFQNGQLIATTRDTKISIDHLQPSTAYTFTVRAYDSGYLESSDSNVLAISTLASDIFANDLIITKYLEGTGQNNAIEITNNTGHQVNLNKYRLSVQFYNTTNANYYFADPYELEGTVQHNETFVVLNPYSNFSCITNDEARFVTAAPQLTFSGSQYFELRYGSTTVDAIGAKNVDNSATLGNVSLYRLNSASHPNPSFTMGEWQTYPSDYCQNIGTLATSTVNPTAKKYSVYPNPAGGNIIYINGQNLDKVQNVSVYDLTGKLLLQHKNPFKSSNEIEIGKLNPGVYLLKVDDQVLKFIKN